MELRLVRNQREDNRERRILAILVALVRFKVRKRRSKRRAIRLDAVTLVDQALVEALLEDPPNALHERPIHRLVALVEIHPTAHTPHRLLPFARVFQHRPATLFVEPVLAIGADLGNAGELQLRLDKALDRKSVAVPSETARNAVALHRPVARHDILDSPGEQVTVMRKPRRKRRPVEKVENGTPFALEERLLESVVFVPQSERTFFDLRKGFVFFYFTEHER